MVQMVENGPNGRKWSKMAGLTLSGPKAGPERPKGAKDEVKRAEGPPPRSQGLEYGS